MALVHISSAGDTLWTRSIAAAGPHYPAGIAHTPTGDVVVFGAYGSMTDLGGPSALPIAAGDIKDFFVAKYAATTGALVWQRAIHADDNDDPGLGDIAIDAAGDIYLVGAFNTSIDFGDGPLVSSSLDPFLVKLEQDGTFLWSRAVGPQASLFIAPDSLGNLYVTGSFSEEIDLGTGVLGANTSNEVYAGKLDADGEPVWVRQFGGPQGGLITSATAHSAGVVVAGASANGVNLGNGPLAGLFVGMLDQDGDTNWSLALGVPYGSGQVAALAQADDNVVLTGYFNGTLVIGSKSLVSTGDSMFLLELAP